MQISFHNEEVPDGVEFDLGGILLVNGETTIISDEQEELFEAKHGITLKEAASRNVHCGGHYVKVDPPEVDTQISFDADDNDDSTEEGDN